MLVYGSVPSDRVQYALPRNCFRVQRMVYFTRAVEFNWRECILCDVFFDNTAQPEPTVKAVEY
jgi:hypothetical protein